MGQNKKKIILFWTLWIKDTHDKARTEQEQTMINRQIAATDKEIDELVYELYGLTVDERKIIEHSTGI